MRIGPDFHPQQPERQRKSCEVAFIIIKRDHVQRALSVVRRRLGGALSESSVCRRPAESAAADLESGFAPPRTAALRLLRWSLSPRGFGGTTRRDDDTADAEDAEEQQHAENDRDPVAFSVPGHRRS
jgi:hypothetical protein